jgi:Domain of unknown function (DUF4136)
MFCRFWRPAGWLAAALPALLWAQKVTVESDPSFEFSSLKTFKLVKGTINIKNPSLNNDLVRKQIEEDIRKKLTEKGLTEADSNADLNVRFTLGAANRREVERRPVRRGWGSRRVPLHYTEGTLVIDLRDPHRQELVWRAVAVQDNADPAKIQGKLDDMVKKAFDKYPPKKK